MECLRIRRKLRVDFTVKGIGGKRSRVRIQTQGILESEGDRVILYHLLK